MFFSKKFIKILSILFLFSFLMLLLTHPKECGVFASYGLNIWYEKMIPTLYPFMLLSQVLLQTGYAYYFSNVLHFLIGRLYSVSVYGVFVLIMGFLSGFPMGALLVSSLLKNNQISNKEGEFLLAFCNNLGPVFILGILQPKCQLFSIPKTLFIVYGIPLIFGLILRYTKYRKETFFSKGKNGVNINISLVQIMENVLNPCLISIARLGGLMIIFNAFQIFLSNRLYHVSTKSNAILSLLIEITGGIERASQIPAVYPIVYIFLPLGGLCCLTQTAIIMKNHDFSMGLHIFYKSIQCMITALFIVL